MVALLVVALSAGLSNLTGAVAIGVAGVDAKLRLQVGLTFGLFESLMPIVGLVLGRRLADELGHAGPPIGGLLLGATGVYTVLNAIRTRPDGGAGAPPDNVVQRQGMFRLVGIAAILSIDNLVIGFALGTYHIGLFLAAITMGAVSVALSIFGLEFGSRLSTKLGDYAEHFAGLLLVGVGVAVGFGVL